MRHPIAASTVLLVLGAITFVTAGEKGRGLGRALSQAGKSAAAPGLNKSSASLSRAGKSLGRAGGMQRAPGLARLGKLPAGGKQLDGVAVHGPKDPASLHQKQLQIEQSHRDHRLAQALKLRALAEKNGNAELAANADRMEAAAQQHYQDRAEHLERFGVSDLSLNPPQGEVVVEVEPLSEPELDITLETPPTESGSATPRAAARGTWKPKWWGVR